jgi:hypothetical protein
MIIGLTVNEKAPENITNAQKRFYNVFTLTRVLYDYTQLKKSFNAEGLSNLNLYITTHVNRFGKHGLGLNHKKATVEFDVHFI